MKTTSINSVFVHIDKTFKQMRERAYELNGKDTFAVSSTYRTDYDPEGKAFIVSKVNSLFYETTEKDYDKWYQVFMFKTTNAYRHTSHEYRDVILKNSELKKVFYKDENVEVGLTIEPTLCYPTETCWGYKFKGYQYYIIKNGVETVTQSRSVVRKIFNNKNIEKTEYSVRITNDVTTYSRAVIELKELNKNVYFLSTDNEDFYLALNKNAMWEYIFDKVITKEWWINDLGGVNDMLEMILNGRNFNPLGYIYVNFEFSDFLPIEEPLNRDKIDFTDMEDDISGYNVFYITK